MDNFRMVVFCWGNVRAYVCVCVWTCAAGFGCTQVSVVELTMSNIFFMMYEGKWLFFLLVYKYELLNSFLSNSSTQLNQRKPLCVWENEVEPERERFPFGRFGCGTKATQVLFEKKKDILLWALFKCTGHFQCLIYACFVFFVFIFCFVYSLSVGLN